MSSAPPPPPAGPTPPGGPQPAQQASVPKPGELLNRFLARLVDHILLGIVYGIFYVILSIVIYSGFSNSFGEMFVFYTLTAILQAVIYVGYFAVMESNRGQTVGKMVMKLKTFGPDGVNPPTTQQAVKRNLYAGLGILSIIPFLGWFFLGWAAPLAAVIYIAVTLNGDVPRHQGWHDKFAGGTQVMQVG